ncbi:MAG TPA: response regulator transcription factor, partial [Actinomycetes bacterium]
MTGLLLGFVALVLVLLAERCPAADVRYGWQVPQDSGRPGARTGAGHDAATQLRRDPGEVETRRHWRESLRLLLIDDSPRFLQAARGLLERQGLTVVGVAAHGSEALRQAQALRPDLTLVDIDLGGESGFELARRLHQEAGLAPGELILISVHDPDDFAELIAA